MPFAGYKDFDECVRKNKDKKDPEAYCAEIKKRVEKFAQSPNIFNKGGVGSGIKGHTTFRDPNRKPPNPDLIEGLGAFLNPMFGEEGIWKVDLKEGTFEYVREITTDGKKELVRETIRLEDRTFILESDGTKITVPERYVTSVAKGFKLGGYAAVFTHLVKTYKGDLKDQHNNLMKDFSKSREETHKYNSYNPEYTTTSPGEGKYAKRMELKEIANNPYHIRSNVPDMWYSGNPIQTALVAEAAQAITTGNLDKDDLHQGPLALMMEASRRTNKNHHTDFVYRGETNVEIAKSLVRGIVERGEVILADKLFSTTENEKLGKWYAAVHSQRTARHTNSKTNVMLKIPYEKYGKNVALDYKVTGSNWTPEMEITILGNGIKLSGNDIMIRGSTPTRKKKTWMTLSKFIKKGGDVEEFIGEMWENPA